MTDQTNGVGDSIDVEQIAEATASAVVEAVQSATEQTDTSTGGSIPFDPSDLTVRDMKEKLRTDDYDDDQLQAVLEAEKNRDDRVTAREALQAAIGDSSPATDPLDYDDLDVEDIEDAVKGADADTLEATLQELDWNKAEDDSIEDGVAKGLISTKGGRAPEYRMVFGMCKDCLAQRAKVNGNNGFEATSCREHSDKSEGSR